MPTAHLTVVVARRSFATPITPITPITPVTPITLVSLVSLVSLVKVLGLGSFAEPATLR